MAIDPKAGKAAVAVGQEAPQESSSRPKAAGARFSLGQRFSVGVNVAVMVVAAAALVVVINWIAARTPVQRDLSTVGRYSMSPRTRAILTSVDKDTPVTMTVLYNSQDPKKVRDEVSGADYKARLMDLLAEMRALGSNVKVVDVRTLDERLKLAQELESAQSREAKAHLALIEQFLKKHEAWVGRIEEKQQQLTPLLTQDTWLGRFANTRAARMQLMELARSLKVHADRLKDLGQQRAGMLTAYDDQAEVLKEAVNETANKLDGVISALGRNRDLYRKLTGDDGGVSANTAKHAAEFTAELKALQAQLTTWKARQPTTQPSDALKTHFDRLARPLTRQGELLRLFVEDQPAVADNAAWLVVVDERRGLAAGMDDLFHMLNVMVQSVSEEMTQFAAGPEFQAYIEDWMQALTMIGGRATQLFETFNQRLAMLKNVDPASRKLLDAEKELLEDVLGDARRMRDELDKLPKLKIRGLASKFEQDNLLLIQVGEHAPTIVDFDTVWPQMTSPMEMGPQINTRRFNGDSAIGSALFALAHPPLAEVVFVHYASAAPQMNPMMMQAPRRQEGPVPYSQLSVLRDRLEQANLRVSEWNLAETLDAPPPMHARVDDNGQPVGDLLPRVYVVLPPPPAMPMNPYQPPQEGFEEHHRQAFIEALGPDGRAIFLSTSTFGQFKDEWSDYLKDGWGIDLRYQARVIMGIPTGTGQRLNVSRYHWFWMLANQFDEAHPIGKALNNRRVLLMDAAPLRVWMPTAIVQLANYLGLDETQKAKASELSKAYTVRLDEVGKRHEAETAAVSWTDREKIRPAQQRELNELQSELDSALKALLTDSQKARLPRVLLQVPAGDNRFFAATDIERLGEQFLREDAATIFPGPEDLVAPLPLMIESTRKSDDGQYSRVIVFGAGRSFINEYLTSRIDRDGDDEGIRREPPPETNPEIVVNSVYHLVAQSNWIAAGPTAVPPINIRGEMVRPILIMVIAGLPAAVLLACGVVLLLRRRS